jgi:hypothetical protein
VLGHRPQFHPAGLVPCEATGRSDGPLITAAAVGAGTLYNANIGDPRPAVRIQRDEKFKVALLIT